MDYKEIRELLLHAEALSVKQAQAILDFWKKTPRAYSDFLRNRGCFTFISAYVGINKDSDHVFEPIKRRVLTPGIAEKFFRLEDDHISIDLINIIKHNLTKQDSDCPMCAFPYLNKSCVKYMSRKFILEMFINPVFVFNFEDDESGKIFDMMYQKVGGAPERELLAVNSFNIDGWASSSRDQRKTAKLYLMSSHCSKNATDEEAYFRKMFLNYIYEVQEGLRMINEQIQKEMGIILN